MAMMCRLGAFQTPKEQCTNSKCMWSSVINMERCMLKGKEPDYSIPLEEMARHKGITVKLARKEQSLAKKRIHSLLVLDRLMQFITINKASLAIENASKRPDIRSILEPIYASPLLATPIPKDNYLLVAILDKQVISRFVQHIGFKVDIADILEVDPKEVRKIRNLLKENT